MKLIAKIFLILFLVFAFIPQSIAFEYFPKYQNTVGYWGIGVYNAPSDITIYSEPDENSEPLIKLHWGDHGLSSDNGDLKISNTMVAYVPDKKLALFTVEDEEEGWCKIFYDQKNGASGWVKKQNDSSFQSWLQFMNSFGRNNFLYFWADLPSSYKIIKTAPDEQAQDTAGCYYPENIKLQIVRGNWMLVRVLDVDKTIHVGWLKWRDKDGKLFVFPRVSQ